MRRLYCSRMQVVVVVLLFLGMYPSAFAAERSMEDVRLYDTGGLEDEKQWTLVTGTEHSFSDSEHIVLENEFFRVTYPSVRKDQQAGHSYFVKHKGEWSRVTGEEYGDYTYFVDSVWTRPYKIEIVNNSPQDVSVLFTYYHQNYRPSPGSTFSYQGDMQLRKTLSLKKGFSGVFVGISSTPTNPKGEREIGFGVESPLVFTENVIALHPLSGGHVDLKLRSGRRPYGVSIPLSDTFYRILILPRPMRALSYQFGSTKIGGRLMVNYLVEHPQDRYQAFLGAMPFDSSHSLLEAEDFSPQEEAVLQDGTANGGAFVRLQADGATQSMFPLTIPSKGKYRIVTRYRSSASSIKIACQYDGETSEVFMLPSLEKFGYFVLDESKFFPAGTHSLTLSLEEGSLDLDNLSVLPVESEVLNFPLDVVRKVSPHFPVIPSSFEGEKLFKQTGRNQPDESASNGMARVAFVGRDRPGFLTFGPNFRLRMPGEYVAKFSLKVQGRIPEPVATVEVVSGSKVFARTVLRGRDFLANSEYQDVELRVTIPDPPPPKPYKLEFRVYFAATTTLWVDAVEFSPVIDE